MLVHYVIHPSSYSRTGRLVQVIGEFPRGSEWRQWDLHIHSPASFHWGGQKLDPNPDAEINRQIIDEMVEALNAAEPAVFCIMDYWTFDGWFALKRRLSQAGAPKLKKKVFPGIELRLVSPTTYRLNAHVIFSDTISDQALHDFRGRCRLQALGDRPLSNPALIELARSIGPDMLNKHGFSKEKISSSDDEALIAGSKIAEINPESYKQAIASVPNGEAIGFMPFDTNDGLSKVDWSKHYAFALGLFANSPIFETRNADIQCAFVNLRTEGNAGWIENFQFALNNVPRLAVSGSDAHRFNSGTSGNDSRGYGDFPSGKITWIKADPTWSGLLQAIREPQKRSYIGALPAKLDRVAKSKTYYIDKVAIRKVAGSTLPQKWLDGCEIPLNPDLVAIIGNKGSGKSALADVIALLGDSKDTQHFSFLAPKRFRGRSGEPARQFEGQINWIDGRQDLRLLSDDPSPEKPELVRYVPQGRFEHLCNEHVSGRSNAFERELRSVIFTHTPSSVRLGALDFDQLIENQEMIFRAKLSEIRKNLRQLNQEIVLIEDQLQPEIRKNISEVLNLKSKELAENENVKPVEVTAPAEELTAEQLLVSEKLSDLAVQLLNLDDALKAVATAQNAAGVKKRAAKNITERSQLFAIQFNQFVSETRSDFETLGVKFEDVFGFSSDLTPIQKAAESSDSELVQLVAKDKEQKSKREALLAEHQNLKGKLNEPQQIYQAYLSELAQWSARKAELIGDDNVPDSVMGLKARIGQLDGLPAILASKKSERIGHTSEIFGILADQRASRQALFDPVQALIQENSLIRDDYKLQFQANIGSNADLIASSLFSIIKQNVGQLRGEDESLAAVTSRFNRHDFNTVAGTLGFIGDINDLVDAACQQLMPGSVGVRAILRKDKTPSELYDYLFGLSYLEPKYSLLFQETQIEQLSPGQRGALLLIFYLLVDKARNPIILDQPEENLDNETVVSLLVPVLNEAKKYRQIIMVTHNPNLAVVCDAEQIIFAEFDRKDEYNVCYEAGAIENARINKHVVNVLEGTKPAFDNRGQKYH